MTINQIINPLNYQYKNEKINLKNVIQQKRLYKGVINDMSNKNCLKNNTQFLSGLRP